jgi:hypothetical protein
MATFFGGSADESATGTNNKDTLEGNGGNDSLYGLGDRDSLAGGDGNDQLFGGSDRDTLFGGNGDDLLDSGTGDESVFGGTGADRIILTGSFGDDTVFGRERLGVRGYGYGEFGRNRHDVHHQCQRKHRQFQRHGSLCAYGQRRQLYRDKCRGIGCD